MKKNSKDNNLMDYITEFVDDNPHKPLPKQDFPDMIPQIII